MQKYNLFLQVYKIKEWSNNSANICSYNSETFGGETIPNTSQIITYTIYSLTLRMLPTLHHAHPIQKKKISSWYTCKMKYTIFNNFVCKTVVLQLFSLKMKLNANEKNSCNTTVFFEDEDER